MKNRFQLFLFKMPQIRRIKVVASLICLSPIIVSAQTSFKVQTDKGLWSVSSNSQNLSQISSQLNGKNILLNVKSTASGFHTTIDGLNVVTKFKVINSKWVQSEVSVSNTTIDTLFITSYEPFIANCDKALKGSVSDDLMINTADKPIDIIVSTKEVIDLKGKHLLTDIFTREQINHAGGNLKITLKEYDSKCLFISGSNEK